MTKPKLMKERARLRRYIQRLDDSEDEDNLDEWNWACNDLDEVERKLVKMGVKIITRAD